MSPNLTHSNFVDAELAKLWLAAIGATGLTLAQLNTGLTTVILIGTAIYTWRKALRRHRRK